MIPNKRALGLDPRMALVFGKNHAANQ